MDDSERSRSNLRSLSGAGFEFTGAIVGFTLVGYWIDRHYQTSPRYLLICFGVGLIGATYNLIKHAMASAREMDRKFAEGRKKGR